MTKKVLLINDMPGYGKVAIPAMMPALIRRRYEVFSLPTMIVSNTFNYGKFASIDTTSYMKEAVRIWDELGFSFDAVATGYIASDEQAEFLSQYCRELSGKGAVVLVDPIMADNGKLYNSVSEKRVEIMKKMVAVADYVIPNITEACLLTGHEYKPEGYETKELFEIARDLHRMGAKSVAITSASVKSSGEASGSESRSSSAGDSPASFRTQAVVGYDSASGECFTVKYDEIPARVNGSGDTFASILLSAILEGTPYRQAVSDTVTKVRELIIRNLDIVKEYNGLPLEADIEVL